MKKPKTEDGDKKASVVWGAISLQFRENMRVSRARLAKALKVSPRTISRWENAEIQPSKKQKEQLAEMIHGFRPRPAASADTGAQVVGSEVIEKFVRDAIEGIPKVAKGKVFEERVAEYQKLKATRLRESPHTRVHPLSLTRRGDPPENVRTLRKYVHDEQWRVVVDFSPAIINDLRQQIHEKKSKNEDKGDVAYLVDIAERVQVWLAIATMRVGDYAQARTMFENLVSTCENQKRRNLILHGNLAWVYLRLNELERAKEAARKSLEEDESWMLGLYNSLCIACEEERVEDCKKYTSLLKEYHERDLKDPDSKLGRGFREDPDLDYIREEMPEMIEEITGYVSKSKHTDSPKDGRFRRVKSVPFIISVVVFLVLSLFQTQISLAGMSACEDIERPAQVGLTE